MNRNILVQNFQTKHHSAPFEKIKVDDYLPAFKDLITSSELEIQTIAENPAEATFENTIEAMAYSGEKLDVVSNIFFNLNSAETSDQLQHIAQEVSPLLSEFSSKISQNSKLFARIKKVYNERQNYSLTLEQETLLKETYKGFVRSGALLSDPDKKKLEQINMDLSIKTLQFGQNVLAATNDYFKHVSTENELKGIPKPILDVYAEDAKERGLEGYVITLQYPSYLPVMTYAENRDLRRELFIANGRKAFDGGAFDNQNLIKEIIALRQAKAKFLGFSNYAEYVLEERMAKSPSNVKSFLKELLEKASPHAEREFLELQEMAKKDGIDELQSYDHAFYAEKLRKDKFDLNDEELKPYFQLENVEKAVFELAKKLFGLHFVEVHDIEKYHEQVRTFEIFENGTFKALLYVDYFPRKGKRAGAWMTSFKNQYKKAGVNHRPHISVVCNFSKPTAETPSLLTFQEVTTLFHEFGHALHGVLADTQYPTLSGTSVKWDFVELPSQFLENFCYEPDFLKTFANHYQTNELLPDEKIKKISDSKNFMEGYQTLRQVGFGLLDLSYHSQTNTITDVKTFETQETKATTFYPSNPETAISTSFSHIFQGGYSAGYYSYKWAEVLDADAFQYFKEHGIFNSEIAKKYKFMLSQGGTQDPMKLYVDFRGSEPQVESLLKRAFG